VPTKLFVDAQVKTAVLKIVNEGDEKVAIQLDAKRWRQDESGKDVYDATGDIIFFPKILNIEKGQTQIIRIGFQGAQKPGEETYRLFLQELPVIKPGEMALKFALTLSIPVFVKPLKEAPADWSAEPSVLSEETLRVKVKNNGNRHISVSKIKVVGLDEAGVEVFKGESAGWYTLSGTAKIFPVSISFEDCLKAKTIQVATSVDKETKTFRLNVEKEMCTRKPEEVQKRTKENKPH
jgi:fimbrial chaperone protein